MTGICNLLVILGSPVVYAEIEDTTANTIISTLVGYTTLPADTFASGPNSGTNDGNGQPIKGGRQGPFKGQPVQGFSGVQKSPFTPGNLLFVSDNGFGTKANSCD